MDYQGIEIVCPSCRRDLHAMGEHLVCVGCTRRYPVIAGIPDLRLWPDPYIGFEEDRAKGITLAAACRGLSFADSVALYYRLTTVVPAFQARAFTRGLQSAVPRATFSLDRWGVECATGGPGLALAANERAESRSGPASARLLDVGCGTAPLLVAASGRYERVVGIDVAFRWLILARKRLEEAGVESPIMCACAEALPFGRDEFTHVVLDSTLEHLHDPPSGLREVRRVMRSGGCLFLTTPNRYSLGPDPQAGIWAGGWLPDRVIGWWVRRRGGLPPHRHLLSSRVLRALLARTGFERVQVFVSPVPDAQRAGFGRSMRHVIDGYNRVVRSSLGRALLMRVGPVLHAVARKPESPVPRASASSRKASVKRRRFAA